MKRIVPITVADEHVIGSGVSIGAAGSHNDVALRMTFSALWAGLSKQIYWTNALGEEPTLTVLGPAELVDGTDNVYQIDVPAPAKSVSGKMSLDIKGFEVAEGKQIRATLTTTAYFDVLPSTYWRYGSPDVPPSLAEQLQAEIDAIGGQTDAAIEAHNTDPDAHADIRAEIEKKLDSTTIKADGLPGVVDAATLHKYCYERRKDTSRCVQLEVGKGANVGVVNALGGYPDGASADDRAYIYLAWPYTEAGGFVIHARYQLRNRLGVWEQERYATYSTTDPTWHLTGWIKVDEDTPGILADHIADRGNPHRVTAKQTGAELARMAVKVTGTAPSGLTADKTYKEIEAAETEGRETYVAYGGRTYDKPYKGPGGAYCYTAITNDHGVSTERVIAILTDNSVEYAERPAVGVPDGGTDGQMLVRLPSGALGWATPAAPDVDKAYVDKQDKANLRVAENFALVADADILRQSKAYADNKDSTTLQSAKTYTNQQIAAIPEYTLPTASSTALGGVKADPAQAGDTQPVRIRDGKLVTAPSGSGGVTPEQLATKEDWATEVMDTLPEITDEASLRLYFYALRKEQRRKWQFEVETGKNQNIVTALGGFPDGVSASDKYFVYIEIPYSEAGGFVIAATLEGRTNGVYYEQRIYGTLNANWRTTGWYKPNASGGGVTPEQLNAPIHTTMSVEITDDGFGGYDAYWNGAPATDAIINAHRNADGLVFCYYYDAASGVTHTYYYSNLESTREPTFERTYIEDGVTKQVLISVDSKGKCKLTRRTAEVVYVQLVYQSEGYFTTSIPSGEIYKMHKAGANVKAKAIIGPNRFIAPYFQDAATEPELTVVFAGLIVEPDPDEPAKIIAVGAARFSVKGTAVTFSEDSGKFLPMIISSADAGKVPVAQADFTYKLETPSGSIPAIGPEDEGKVLTAGPDQLPQWLPASGREKPWTEPKLIADLVVTEDTVDAVSFSLTVAEYPELAEVNRIMLMRKKAENTSSPWVEYEVNNIVLAHPAGGDGGMTAGVISINGEYATCVATGAKNISLYPDWNASNGLSYQSYGTGRPGPKKVGNVKSVSLSSYTKFADVGTRIYVWGWNE